MGQVVVPRLESGHPLLENIRIFYKASKQMIEEERKYRAIVHYEHFMRSLRKVASLYKVSKSSLQRWCADRPKIRKRRSTKQIGSEIRRCIQTELASRPMLTMSELCYKVSKSCKVNPSVNTVGRWVRGMGYTRKKVKKTIAHSPNSDIVNSFCDTYSSLGDDDIVCIDEAGFYVGDHRRFGYSKSGQNIKVSASSTLRRSRFTLVMAITRTGILHYKVLHGSCKKDDFVAFVKALPDSARGKTLVMDNLNSHHSIETREAATSKECKLLFVPPYSPRYNAIEYAFNLKKRQYRSECTVAMDDPTYSRSSDVDFVSILIQVLETGDWDYSSQFNRVRKSIRSFLDGGPFERYD